ncbi:MAG: acyl-CoA dehydrogenase family protein [Fimbriimonadaceae bacterium]|nr:acyl-CoA dehydrogenase family protein [Fimbriimonadaceae bacterium]
MSPERKRSNMHSATRSDSEVTTSPFSSESGPGSNDSAARRDAHIRWLRSFARTRLNSDLSDDRRSIQPNVLIAYGRRGFCGFTWPEAQGGAGLTVGDGFRVLRQISAIDLSHGLAIGLHNFLACQTILHHATPAAFARHGEPLISGRELAAFALTELSAGSDPRRIRSTAHQLADGSWRLRGRKIWSGLAAWGDVAAFFARAYDTDGRDLGITAFLLPLDAPGVVHLDEAVTMGLRSVVQSAFEVHDTVLGAEMMLGEAGRGLDVAQGSMMLCRLGVSVFSHAGMIRCLQAVSEYAAERTISTGSLAANPVVADLLEEHLALAHGLDLFLEGCFGMLDRGETIPAPVYVASKIVGPEIAFDAADASLQLMGGRGYIETNVVARVLRDLRVLRIFEGPTETLAAYLGSIASVKPATITEVLEATSAPDLVGVIAPVLDSIHPKRPENRGVSREEWQRRGHHAGLAIAMALFLAVARRQAATGVSAMGESDPVADARAIDALERALRQRVQALRPPSAAATTTDALTARIQLLVGDVREQRGGEQWSRDPVTDVPFVSGTEPDDSAGV